MASRSGIRLQTTFLRSPQLWFNHITAMCFVIFLLVGRNVHSSSLPLTPQFAMAQVGFVALFGALNPGMTALSLEHLGVWVLRSAPFSARQILTAKFTVAFGQAGVVAAVSAAALAIGYRFSPQIAAVMVAFAVCASASAISAGIAFDSTFPSFAWENPNQINRGLRMVIPFLVNVATLAVCSALLFAAQFVIPNHGLALGVGLTGSIALQAAVAIAALRMARRNIALLEV